MKVYPIEEIFWGHPWWRSIHPISPSTRDRNRSSIQAHESFQYFKGDN